MAVESKLDEDFLFYLGFTNTFLRRITDSTVFHHAKMWIYKLCGETCDTVERKRNRNMYLANLLICMQNGKLEEPFTQAAAHVDISDAMEVFGEIPDTVEQPTWLNDTDFNVDAEKHTAEKKGRTYFATRTLPQGQGAFAYIGVSLTGDDWIGGAGDVSLQRGAAIDRQLEEKFQEYVPPQYEMEKILAKRKDPREREKVLTFYDVLLQNVADELDGKGPVENEIVDGLIEQLINDLKEKNQYDPYEALEEYDRRNELLLILYSRVKARRDKVAKREEYLDDIEQQIMPKSFFETSVEAEDQYELPAAMWQQAISKLPSKKQMEKLQEMYPLGVIEKFVGYLASFKEEIAERMHRRHENIVTQMKKELRKEGQKKKKEAERIDKMCNDTEVIYAAVKEHYQKKIKAEEQYRSQFETQLSEHSKLYEEMKAAILDTQKLVEQEALKGKFLASQINAVSEQNEQFHQVNDDIVKKTEEANMKLLRNIKRLNAAIKQYESRINDFRTMAENSRQSTASSMMVL